VTRTPLVAANWKMHKTRRQAQAYFEALLPALGDGDDVEVAVCVPFTALDTCVDAASGSRVRVFAQNMHEELSGPFTGEVAAPMLVEAGVEGVVLGHSERREHFAETDRALAQKLPTAVRAGLTPILCVGETEEEREGGLTERKLRHQVQEGIHHLGPEEIATITIAYEPIWAIGTGQVATAEQAQEAVAFIRALVADRAPGAAQHVRVLYGGSVKPANAAELLELPDVDGALVGSASLEPEVLVALVEQARELVRTRGAA
jgi:triosephosphate isomerase